MDFIRKPEVLATANAVGTASIYFILSKRLNALTDEVDEIDNHLSSSIKKISDNSRSIHGITEAFKEVLIKFEEHKKNINNISRTFKNLDDDIQDLNDRYDALVEAVKELGGNVDIRKTKKKKKGKDDKRRSSEPSRSNRSDSSESESSSESERDKKSKSKDSIRIKDSKSSSSNQKNKEDENSDEDFAKKAEASKNKKN
jgi:chromosome segregation ATPase